MIEKILMQAETTYKIEFLKAYTSGLTKQTKRKN